MHDLRRWWFWILVLDAVFVALVAAVYLVPAGRFGDHLLLAACLLIGINSVLIVLVRRHERIQGKAPPQLGYAWAKIVLGSALMIAGWALGWKILTG